MATGITLEDTTTAAAWFPGGKLPQIPEGWFGKSGPFARTMRAVDPPALMQEAMALAKSLMEIAWGTLKFAPDARDWRFQAAGTATFSYVDTMVNRLAAMLAYLDDFYLVMWVSVFTIPLVLLRRTAGRR